MHLRCQIDVVQKYIIFIEINSLLFQGVKKPFGSWQVHLMDSILYINFPNTRKQYKKEKDKYSLIFEKLKCLSSEWDPEIASENSTQLTINMEWVS